MNGMHLSLVLLISLLFEYFEPSWENESILRAGKSLLSIFLSKVIYFDLKCYNAQNMGPYLLHHAVQTKYKSKIKVHSNDSTTTMIYI